MDRVQQRKQLSSLISVAKHRKRDHRPDGAMSILTAVFSNAGRIPLDVSEVERCAIKGRCEEQGQPVIAMDKLPVYRRHRYCGAPSFRGPGEHSPRLCDRINSTLGARLSTERSSIVEIRSPVPAAIPTVPLERLRERGGMPPPARATRLLATTVR